MKSTIVNYNQTATIIKKTELGTKAARSQLCIISSVSAPSTLTLYPIGCNTQVLNPYYTLSGII